MWRRGNQLFYTKSLELHALWDTKLVEKFAGSKSPSQLAEKLVAGADMEKWKTAGDYHEWPERWVGQSAAEAIEVYRGITLGQATLDEKRELGRIEITLPDGYNVNQMPRVEAQLGKAATHLAQLLNSIHFK